MNILIREQKKEDGVITETIPTSAKIDVSFRDIELMVSKITGVGPDEMFQRSRKHEVKLARQMCHYLSRKYTEESLSSIGNYFGRMNHATVLHSTRTIQNMIDVRDREIFPLVNEMEMTLLDEFLKENE